MKSEKDGRISEGSDRSTFSKVLETIFLILTWLAMSTYVEIYGPTLIDLKLKLNTDYEQVAIATSGRSVGWFPGSIIGGFLVDRFSGYSHLMIAVALDIAAGVTVAIPLVPNTSYTWVFCFIGGCMESVINIAGTRILFNTWKEKSVSPLMLVHLGYGIGSFLVPLYSNPFLADTLITPSGNSSSIINNSGDVYISTQSPSLNNITEEPIYGESRIEYAYAISSTIVVAMSIAFYINQIYSSRESRKINIMAEKREKENSNLKPKKKTIKEMVNPASCANGRLIYGMQILFLIFFYFGNLGGGDRMIGSFMRSYSIDELKFSKTSASLINTVYWISFAVGRFFFSILSRCISVRILLVLQASGMAISSVLLMFLAGDSPLAFWVLIQCFGFFASSTWPTGVAWTDYHIELTGLGMTWQILGASIGGICHLRLIGYLYENVGPITFLYQTLGYGVLQLVIAVSLTLVGCQHGDRLKDNKDSKNEVEISTIS